ncbi:MAG: SAP domain-containing protein [Lachnospiraceae bacterium]|nr:SAP domain-containing protein [Lachnospiraceae bacterium]
MSVLQKILGVLKPQSSLNIKVSLQDENVSESAAIASPADLKFPYRDYAITLMLKAYGNVEPIPAQYSLYYERECGLTNPRLLHQQLIDEGFLELSSLSQLLTTLKVSDLQQILRSYGLKVSGKKEELISQVLSDVDMEDLFSFFKNEPPRYSLSLKGRDFLEQHKDYIRFHRYTKYGVTLEEYERAKASLCYTDDCEKILIFLYNEKVDGDKYNRHYHLVLHELYEATGDSDNALREFLIVKYFDVNYVYSFQQLSFFLQYQSFSTAAKEMYESEKNHHVLAPSDAFYVAEHQNMHLRNILNSIYSQYLLKDLIIPPNVFSTIVSEMITESFFDVSKWNTYLLSQLKHYLRLR